MPEHPPRYERPHHERSPFFSRRSFLKTSGLTLAGATLYACTGGERKAPVLVPSATASVVATETRWPIKRVIYVMLENRSFDNLFGRFPGANGSTTGVKFGTEVELLPAPHWLPGDLPHDRAAHLNDVNGGAYDGFGQGQFGDPWAYTAFEGDKVPVYWQLASDYVLCDNFFASVGGPSYPNHFFFVAGQSGGALDNPENIEVRVEENGKRFKSWGCDAVGDNVFVLVKDDLGNLTKHDSCFNFRSVPEQLEDEGVSWAYYSASPNQSGYFWNALNGIAGVYHTDLWRDETIRPVDRIVKDVQQDKLPSVTWVTPRFELSDHPPESTCFAQNWLADLTNAVMQSDGWEHTAMFVTWDEWGGLLRPRPAAGRRRHRSRLPRPDDRRLAVREEGLRRRRRGASSPRRSSSSRTTGACPTSRRGSSGRTTSSTSSTSRRTRGRTRNRSRRSRAATAPRGSSRATTTRAGPPRPSRTRRRSCRREARLSPEPNRATSSEPRAREEVGRSAARRCRRAAGERCSGLTA